DLRHFVLQFLRGAAQATVGRLQRFQAGDDLARALGLSQAEIGERDAQRSLGPNDVELAPLLARALMEEKPADFRVSIDGLFIVGAIPAGVTVLAGVVAVDYGDGLLRLLGLAGGEQKQRAPGGAVERLVRISVTERREALVELPQRVVPGALEQSASYPLGRLGPTSLAGEARQLVQEKPGADVVLGAHGQHRLVPIQLDHLVAGRTVGELQAALP